MGGGEVELIYGVRAYIFYSELFLVLAVRWTKSGKKKLEEVKKISILEEVKTKILGILLEELRSKDQNMFIKKIE